MTETVYIIDDDAYLRGSVDSLLRSVGHVTEMFGSTHAFAEKWLGGRNPAGCLVLDVRLPGQSGLDFQRALADAKMRIPIIFMSAHADVTMSVQAMKAGAVEFLTKPFRDQDLLDAIQTALETGRQWRIEDAALEALLTTYRALAPRERETLSLVAAGQTHSQIARALGVSEATAKVTRGQLMKKLNAPSLVDLLRIALEIERSIAERG